MDFSKISSKSNPLIKLTKLLQTSASARKENGLFVLEGLRICCDACENDIIFKNLIVSETALNKHNAVIETLSGSSENNIVVTDDVFKKISETQTPQGILALAYIPKIKKNINKNGMYIALENIADPSNLGAISRTAEALGIDGIFVSVSGCDPYCPKAIRASMGTLLRMPLYICDNVLEFIKENHLKSFACVVDNNAESIKNIYFSGGDVIIIGNEANGLADNTKLNSDHRITIPMKGKAESLNAAAAAAVVMWKMIENG